MKHMHNRKDPKQQTKWHEAIKKEFRSMTNQGVWHKGKCSIIPKRCRCIKSKWMFKIKCNGIFQACLVACGYSQIPSIDFT